MRLISRSVKDTLKLGSKLAGNLKAGDIVCLFGELGSGKTVLTKGIAFGLGIKKVQVNSPSFLLLREYSQGKIPLYHFDLYRLTKQKDIMAIGYEEYLYDEGITVIEWADRLRYLLPKEFLKIELFLKANTQRLLKFTAFGNSYKTLLEKIA
jgi:tRNA threonylcarbamoyladenosine biosynthesis protein TsaE